MIINGQELFVLKPIKNMIGTKERIHGLSYGLSEVGYDFRIKQKVEFFPPDHRRFLQLTMSGFTHWTQDIEEAFHGCTVVHTDQGMVRKAGRTAIGSSVEEFDIPPHLWCEFRNKSTHARKFLDASLGTDGEPGWKGHLTIEMVFQGNERYTLEAGTPILKGVFHEIKCPTEYQGKYQNQPDKPVEAIFEQAP